MKRELLTKAYRYFNLVNSQLGQPRKNLRDLACLDLENEISRYRTAIVYVGLSSVEANSAGEAVGLIRSAFGNTENFIVPGFTPSFRRSGVYSVMHSRPEIGAFSKSIFKLGFERTLDPIHSLFIIRGAMPHKTIMGDTFHPDGVYKSFTSEDACIVNIGTPKIVSTNLHYIERLAGVPYLEKEICQGVIMLPNGHVRDVKHTSYRYKNPIQWNRKKIENLWIENNCMKVGLWNGALCRVIDGAASMSCLQDVLSKDPYFMVTF